MAREDAQQWYDQKVNDPPQEYITPDDAKQSVYQIYSDMSGVVQVGNGINGLLNHFYTPDAFLHDVDPDSFVGLNPQGWIDRGVLGDSGVGVISSHGDLTGLEADDHPQYLTSTRGDARYQVSSAKGQPNGYAPLDGDGKIPAANIPALAIDNTFVVTSEAEMLALTAQVGDMAVRTDTDQTFVLSASPASTLGNWIPLTSSGQVTSVNGQTGVVSLDAGDIPSTATTTISATTVQGALAELDTEKATPAEISAAVAGHEAAGDPHPQYLTSGEAPQPGGVPQNTNALAAAAGTSALYAREDHKHYTQVGAPVALGAANANGISNFMARADHVHIYPTAANVGADPTGTASSAVAAHVALGDPHAQYLTAAEAPQPASATPGQANTTAGSVGVSALYAREDHRHQTPTAVAVALGSVAAAGTGSSLARADHVHPFPMAAEVGAAAASHTHLAGDLPAGMATDAEVTSAVSTHTSGTAHVALSSTTPAALGAAGNVGVGTTSARADHVHIRPTPAEIGAATTAHSHVEGDLPAGMATEAEVTAAISAHAGAADPHPIYLTSAEAPQPHTGSMQNVIIDGTASAGIVATLARGDHEHKAPTSAATPQHATAGTGSAGGASSLARSDHSHQVDADPPVALGAAIAEGTSLRLARADHVHPFPTHTEVGAPITGTFVVGTLDDSPVAAGIKKAYWNAPVSGFVTRWKLIADAATTASVDVVRSSSMPTFTLLGNSALSAAQVNSGNVMWAISKDDILDIQVLNNSTAVKLVLELTIT